MAMFSISDLRTFKKCRRLALFTMSCRMNLHPKRPAIYYTVGTIAHEALERYYNGDATAWKFYREEIEKATEPWRDHPVYDELYLESTSFEYVLQAYMKRWAPQHDHFELLGTEVRDLIELPSGHHFTFKYDGLVQKPDGSIWIKEFKTTRSTPSDLSWLQLDDQAAAYQWAVEQASQMKISGTIYTWIRKKVPTKPKELASGGLQERKNIVTTAEAYYDGIVEAGYNPSSYKDFLQMIASREGDNFFLRAEVITSAKQRELMGEHINEMSKVISDEATVMYPCPSERNCVKCDFFGPCAAMSLGRNYKVLLREEYEEGGYY